MTFRHSLSRLQELSGRALLEILPPKAINDCVILLSKDETWLWVPKSKEGQQLLLTSHCSIRRSTLSIASSDDADHSEQEKMKFFVDNISQFGQVAAAVDAASAMDIEKWPLVQAFALEHSWLGSDVTSRKQKGFLTMTHKPVGVLKDLQALFSDVDACALEQIVCKNVPQLLYHFDSILTRMHRCSPGQRQRLAESDIGEPVSDPALSQYLCVQKSRKSVSCRQTRTCNFNKSKRFPRLRRSSATMSSASFVGSTKKKP